MLLQHRQDLGRAAAAAVEEDDEGRRAARIDAIGHAEDGIALFEEPEFVPPRQQRRLGRQAMGKAELPREMGIDHAAHPIPRLECGSSSFMITILVWPLLRRESPSPCRGSAGEASVGR
jgi:hypothetical protein